MTMKNNILKILNEEISLKELNAIAKGVDYDTFLNKTDSLASRYFMLYRGSADESLHNNIFMTDYIGHAREYGEHVEGIVADSNDLLRFNDNVFSGLRGQMRKLSKQDLMTIYKPYFDGGKVDAYGITYKSNGKTVRITTDKSVIEFVFKFIQSSVRYSNFSKQYDLNNLLVPIMQHYAKLKGKNIISFLGGDYADYGGQDEFVVGDTSKYVTLKSIWEKANKVF